MNAIRPGGPVNGSRPGHGAACAAAAVLLVVVRQFFTAGLPLYVRGSTCDDALMVSMAGGLLRGDWLGPYDGLTLMKGCFFPMFLAAVRACGLPYLGTLTALHSAACLYFVHQLRPVVKGRAFSLLLLAVLLFDPSSMAERSYQAIYRTTLTGTQVLLITGSFFGIYHDPGKRPAADLLRGLFGGFVLWSFFNTREDAVWLLPFAVTASALIAVRAVRSAAAPAGGRRLLCAGLLSAVLPFLVLSGGNALVRAQNLKHYGKAVRLECADGEFAKALKAIYTVKNRQDIRYVSVSREKLDRLCAVSPALASVRGPLNELIAMYDRGDRCQGDGEAEDGFFLWALKRAALTAGRTPTLEASEAFFRAVREEVGAALDDPSGGFERVPAMPSALMSPLQADYPAGAARAFFRALRAAAAYEGVSATALSGYTEGRHGAACACLTGARLLREEDAGTAAAVRAEAAAARVGVLSRIYGAVNAVLFPAAGLAWLALLVLHAARRSKGGGPYLLTAAGLILSVFVDLAGIAYTEVSAFPAIRCDYLAGAYPLILAFTVLTAGHAVRAFLRGRRRSDGER